MHHLLRSAADAAGLSPDTLRSYCRQGLITPERDSAGRRLFSDEDIALARQIRAKNLRRQSDRLSHAGQRPV